MSAPTETRHGQHGRFRRALGAPILFSIIYTSVASATTFSSAPRPIGAQNAAR